MKEHLDRRIPYYIVINPKGGKEENLLYEVQAFEDKEDAEDWIKDSPHCYIETKYIVQSSKNIS